MEKQQLQRDWRKESFLEVPDFLKDFKILSLDMTALTEGTKFEAILKMDKNQAKSLKSSLQYYL